MKTRAGAAPTDSSASGDATTDHQGAARADLGFIIIPDFVKHDPRLSSTAKLIYGQLKRFAGRDGKCYPSHGKLALEVCSSVTAVKRHLEELRDVGCITWRRTSRGNFYLIGDRTSTSYQELPKQVLDVPSDSPKSGYQSAESQPEIGPSDSPISGCVVARKRAVHIKSSSKSSSKEPPPPNPPEQSAGGGGTPEQDEQDERAFSRIEKTAKIPTDGKLRSLIAASLKAQDFSPSHLAHWLTEASFKGSTNPQGLLLTIAREFEARSSGSVWPVCFQCGDTAMTAGAPCACEAGRLRAAGLASKAEEKRKTDELKATKTARAEAFKAQGICWSCEAIAGGMEDCHVCNGTGVWRSDAAWNELGACHHCQGLKVWNINRNRPCMGCKGTGMSQVALSMKAQLVTV